MYRYANGGERYTIGNLPTSLEEAGLFDVDASVDGVRRGARGGPDARLPTAGLTAGRDRQLREGRSR